MKRRALVAAGLGAIAAGRASVQAAQPPTADAATPAADPWPKSAFEATSVIDVQARLGIPKPQPGNAVLLEAPDISPAAQPIAIAIRTQLPKVDRIAVLADRLPTPLIAWLQPAPQASTRLRLTIHLPRSSTVRAFLRSDGKWYQVAREVKLALEPG